MRVCCNGLLPTCIKCEKIIVKEEKSVEGNVVPKWRLFYFCWEFLYLLLAIRTTYYLRTTTSFFFKNKFSLLHAGLADHLPCHDNFATGRYVNCDDYWTSFIINYSIGVCMYGMQKKLTCVDALPTSCIMCITVTLSSLTWRTTNVSLLLSCFLIRYAGTVIYRIFTCPFPYARKSVDSDPFFTRKKVWSYNWHRYGVRVECVQKKNAKNIKFNKSCSIKWCICTFSERSFILHILNNIMPSYHR